MFMERIVTEIDIIDARERIEAADAAHEQQDFEDALLASPDLTPEMVRLWLNATLNVRWCACKAEDTTPRIVCETCGLPPFWTKKGTEE